VRISLHVSASLLAIFGIKSEARAQSLGEVVSGVGTLIKISSLLPAAEHVQYARNFLGTRMGITGDVIQVAESYDKPVSDQITAGTKLGLGAIAMLWPPSAPFAIGGSIIVDAENDYYKFWREQNEYNNALKRNEEKQSQNTMIRNKNRFLEAQNYEGIPRVSMSARRNFYGSGDNFKISVLENTPICGSIEWYYQLGGGNCLPSDLSVDDGSAFDGVWQSEEEVYEGMLLEVEGDAFALRFGSGLESCGTTKGTLSRTSAEVTGSFQGRCTDLNMKGKVGLKRSGSTYRMTMCVSMAMQSPDDCSLGYYGGAQRAGK